MDNQHLIENDGLEAQGGVVFGVADGSYVVQNIIL